jgi:cobalt-zinc-cadmium efflux system protein
MDQRTYKHKIKEQFSLTHSNKLKIVFLLSSCYLISAIVIVLQTGSLSLLSETGHMIADVAGIALALFAINYTKKPPTPERTYGFFRMEILASLTNSVVLILLSIYILYEAFFRIFEPPHLQSMPIIIAAAVGLIVNFLSMRILSTERRNSVHSHGLDGHDVSDSSLAEEKEEHEINNHLHNNHHSYEDTKEQNLNIKSAYLETLSDTIGAAGVLSAGIIMLTTNIYLADPLISIGLALFMIPRTWSIIKKAIHILMEGSPYNISHEDIKEAILNVRGVTGIFELHIWTITSGMHALSAHVVIIDPSRSHEILQEINSILENRFKITHATIQLERYHSESNVF